MSLRFKSIALALVAVFALPCVQAQVSGPTIRTPKLTVDNDLHVGGNIFCTGCTGAVQPSLSNQDGANPDTYTVRFFNGTTPVDSSFNIHCLHVGADGTNEHFFYTQINGGTGAALVTSSAIASASKRSTGVYDIKVILNFFGGNQPVCLVTPLN